MAVEYKVRAFQPKVVGCGAVDNGWDMSRCEQFEGFINQHAQDAWTLHSYEYRQVQVQKGCNGRSGAWLVCIFERGK